MKQLVALVQGSYFLVTGLWPIFAIKSFQKVTSPKHDVWLVKTAGVVIAAIGASLSVAGGQAQVTTATVVLAVGSAAGLASIDLYYVRQRVIAPVYLAMPCWKSG